MKQRCLKFQAARFNCTIMSDKSDKNVECHCGFRKQGEYFTRKKEKKEARRLFFDASNLSRFKYTFTTFATCTCIL